MRKLQADKVNRDHDKASQKVVQQQLAAELEIRNLWFRAAAEGKNKKLEGFLEKQSIGDADVRDEQVRYI